MVLSIKPLSPELEEVAKRELNEDPARREKDIAYIKEWLKKQPHINARTDDQWLLTFLRGCKFSLERTKEKIDTYYTVRTLLPELFANRDPMQPEIQEVLSQGSYLPLPTLDQHGRRVVLSRAGESDPAHHKIHTALKVNFMILDIQLLEDDSGVINGQTNVMDFAKMGKAHMLQMTPSLAKKMIMCFQEAYPVRPKSMNYINFPTLFQAMFNMVQSFMKEKLKKRVHVHANLEDLYKEVSKDVLPKEYGGDGQSMEELTTYWKEKVESYRDWFIEDEKYKTDEKKRVGRPKTQESMFGLEGSFRQLNLD